MTSSLSATLEGDRVGEGKGRVREKCVARGRDDSGSCARQEKARERERRAKGDFREIPWQVASAELCSYFPSTHPMMSTVM